MLAQQTTPAAHAGEDQASNAFDPREDYWTVVEAELLKLPAAARLYAAAVPAVIGGAS